MEEQPKNQYVEIRLNPTSDTDQSKVIVRTSEGSGCSLKWFDCTDSATNYIRLDHTGLAKIERMKVALELAENHIKKGLTKKS